MSKRKKHLTAKLGAYFAARKDGYGLGEALKAAGQAAVAQSSKEWRLKALTQLASYIGWRRQYAVPEFTMDAFRRDRGCYIGDPPHHNAWGALPRVACARGLMRDTGRTAKANRAAARARMVKLWEPA